MRLVLDTNVWLDWLVFEDPRTRALTHALEQGSVQILATEAMLREFDGVIARPFFKLEPERLIRLSQHIRDLVQPVAPAPDCRLPCTDRADQMFIDLAVAHRAEWLLSRDKALLRLARLATRRFALRIGTPETWLSTQAHVMLPPSPSA